MPNTDRSERIPATALAQWVLGAAAACLCSAALAHEPVARCYLLDAHTVRCRGASNDGDEMSGSRMEVIALSGKTLLEGKLDANSTWSFSKPQEPFYVLFDVGPGLQVSIEQEEISAPPTGATPRWMRQR